MYYRPLLVAELEFSDIVFKQFPIKFANRSYCLNNCRHEPDNGETQNYKIFFFSII